MFSLFFSDKKIVDFTSAKTQDVRLFKKFFHGLLRRDIYFSPSAFEANFLSTAHSAEDLDKTVEVVGTILKDLRR